MDAPFSGGCACGAIRYTCANKPVYMGNCHCRHCQQATGGPYLPAVGVKETDFVMSGDEPGFFDRPADIGHNMRRAFCRRCGSPVFLINGTNPTLRIIYAGSLDDPGAFRPGMNIFTASAHAWDLMDPDLPAFAGMPERRRPR